MKDEKLNEGKAVLRSIIMTTEEKKHMVDEILKSPIIPQKNKRLKKFRFWRISLKSHFW